MKSAIRWPAILAVLLAAAATAVGAVTGELAHPRMWTSASGAQLPAIFVELVGENVVLRKRTGEQIQIPRAKLSAADQALIDEAFGPAAEPVAVAPFGEEPAAEPEETASPPAAAAPAPVPAPVSALRVAGTDIPLAKQTTFRAPLDEEGAGILKKEGNPATEAVVALWLPADFDPAKAWNVLLVSATADSSSVNSLFMYLESAKASGGWIVLAADGPATPPKGDTTPWRWQMARAGLLALEAAWPAVRQWPVATAGFSGGAKRSGLLGALLCADDRTVIGMYMGGCNDDMATKGLQEYRPNSLAFRKVPIYLSTGDQDETATLAAANRVRQSMEGSGFREVRSETYSGGHTADAAQITEALDWFKELQAKRAPAEPGSPRR